MKASIVEMEGLLRGKCVPAKMLVNESLAEYLVRQFDSLHERAESAERERDELRAEQAEHDEQIARMESKFSLAKRALDSKTARCEKAEAELRRRDAAAADILRWDAEKPIAELAESFIYFLRKQPNGERWPVGTKLYTAAQPAVLSPAMTYAEALKVSDWKNDEASIWVEGANWMRQQCLELGAQQQKVVGLYKRKSTEVISGQRYSYVLLEDQLPELDAAGVKWEAQK